MILERVVPNECDKTRLRPDAFSTRGYEEINRILWLK